MAFQNLPQVHPGRHPNGVEDNVNRSAVGQERHILFGQDARHHALVAVPPGHLVPNRNLAGLGHPDADRLLDIGRQAVFIFAAQLLDGNDLAPLSVRNAEGSIANVFGFFAENSPQQALFGSHFRFAFGRYLAHQNVAGPHVGANADDAPLVQVAQAALAHIGNVAGNVFFAQLGSAAFHLVLLNMHRSELVVFHQALADDDGILVVVPFPGHKGHQDILAKGKLAAVSR